MLQNADDHAGRPLRALLASDEEVEIVGKAEAVLEARR